MSDKKKRFAADGRFYRGGMRWMGVGFEFLIVIGACVWGGYWLDKLENTSPGWMILGFFVGFGIMLYVLIQRARRDAEEEQAELTVKFGPPSLYSKDIQADIALFILFNIKFLGVVPFSTEVFAVDTTPSITPTREVSALAKSNFDLLTASTAAIKHILVTLVICSAVLFFMKFLEYSSNLSGTCPAI